MTTDGVLLATPDLIPAPVGPHAGHAVNPQVWWYVARASGIIAWLLLTASVIWGVLLSTDAFPTRRRPAWLLDLHRWLGGLTVAFVAAHLAALVADSYTHFDLADLAIPYASQWRPGAVALGVVATWCLVAVELTSLAMRRLPRKLWRGGPPHQLPRVLAGQPPRRVRRHRRHQPALPGHRRGQHRRHRLGARVPADEPARRPATCWRRRSPGPRSRRADPEAVLVNPAVTWNGRRRRTGVPRPRSAVAVAVVTQFSGILRDVRPSNTPLHCVTMETRGLHAPAKKGGAMMIERVVVPVDFTAESEWAVVPAIRFAEWSGTRLELISVVAPSDRSPGRAPPRDACRDDRPGRRGLPDRRM